MTLSRVAFVLEWLSLRPPLIRQRLRMPTLCGNGTRNIPAVTAFHPMPPQPPKNLEILFL